MDKGFTLIEVMIVVAIISILSAFGVIQYQRYIAKTQVIAVVAELNGAKPQYELIINGASVSGQNDFTVQNMFLSHISNYCTYVVYSPVNNTASPALECKLDKKVSVYLKGESIFLDRDINGTWTCRASVGISDRYKPNNCT